MYLKDCWNIQINSRIKTYFWAALNEGVID